MAPEAVLDIVQTEPIAIAFENQRLRILLESTWREHAQSVATYEAELALLRQQMRAMRERQDEESGV